MGKKNLAAAAFITGVAAIATATATVISKQRKKKEAGEPLSTIDLDQGFTDFKNKIEEIKVSLDNLTADSRDDLKVTLGNIKGDAVHYTEEFKRKAERSKSKLSSELIKAQMNFEVKKKEFEEELENRKYESEKKRDENKARKKAEDAELLMDYALEMVQQATVASLEATELASEYEDKYGEVLDLSIDDDVDVDDIDHVEFDENDIED